MEITDELSVTQMDRKKAISGPVQKAGALFSGGTTLLSALSPLIPAAFMG